MIERFAKETGTGHAQKREVDILHKMRKRMECILGSRDPGAELRMSILHLQEKAVHAAKTLFKSVAPVILVSAVMTMIVYQYCAILAYMERGYKACGGEYLAAMEAGVLTYKLLSWWGKEGR